MYAKCFEAHILHFEDLLAVIVISVHFIGGENELQGNELGCSKSQGL